MTSLRLIFVAMFLTQSEPQTEGWPQWRGPTHDGISQEKELVDTWPATGPRLLWSCEIGQGYSGFAVVGNRLFTQSQSLTEQVVLCLDADTGETVWSYRYGWPSEANGLYPGPKATPTWYASRIYFAAPDGIVGCLNAVDGSLLWSVNPKRQYHGRGTDFGCSCSPVVLDGKVIVPVGGPAASVVALNADDGTTVWASGDAPASYCTPVPIMFRGQRQVVTFLENSLAAFDLQSGRRVWNVEFSQGYDEHAAAPLYREPDILVASPFRSGAKLLRVEAASSDSSAERDRAENNAENQEPNRSELKTRIVWDNPKFSNDVMSSLLINGFVYGFDLKDAQSRLNRPSRGEFRCLDFQTGKIQWSTDQVGQANIIHADGKLILFSDTGELILAEASPDAYRELARTTIFEGEVCWTPPALHRGRLYLRHHQRVVCLYLGQQPLDALQAVQTVVPVPRRWRFDVNRLLGGEREFPATTPEWDELTHWYVWSIVAILVSFGAGQFGIWGINGFRRLRQVLGRSNRISRGVASESDVISKNSAAASNSLANQNFYRRILAWGLIFLLGWLGSAILNRQLDYYIFSWPLSLWCGLQVTLNSISWAEQQSDRNRARRWSRLAGFGLIGLSLGYYWICRRLSLSIEWGFLIGFLTAFPVAAGCSLGLIKLYRLSWIIDPFLSVISFSVYFWSAGGFLKWWLVVGS